MTTTPHDALVRSVFTIPEHAASLLKTNLPDEIASIIDWNTLKATQDTYVDDNLRYAHSDILYQTSIQGLENTAFIYVLFEHQSEADESMPLRMLEYMVRIWTKFRQETPESKKLPLIIPMLFYHGEKEWTFALNFHSFFDVPSNIAETARRFIPIFEILFHDISPLLSEQLRNRPEDPVIRLSYLHLRYLKARLIKEFFEALPQWIDELNQVFNFPEGAKIITVFMVYISLVTGFELDDVKNIFDNALKPQNMEIVMNLVDVLELRGKEAGIKIGEKIGKELGNLERARAHVLKVLKRRNIPVSEKQQKSIQDCDDINQLELWLDLAITCKSAKELFSKPKSSS
jgi:Putative transposase, YhgA-like